MFSASQATTPTSATFIEDVFSTWLYTGNGSTQTITNGIDLAGKGGLVWVKSRSAATDHALYDTARGATFDIASNTITAQTTQSTGLTDFLANGFSIGSLAKINTNAATYASWTFREQPKFFDIVTYTGNGVAGRTVAHNLQSAPGAIIIKATSTTGDWKACCRSSDSGSNRIFGEFLLNSSAAVSDVLSFPISTLATSIAVNSLGMNASGVTYVMYLFAHDAGGFGATGADNVISCGSYTGNGSATGPVVALGYEPQWLLIRRVGGGDWNLIDNMRGFPVGANDAELNPNLPNSESTGTFVRPTATGFQLETTDIDYNQDGFNYIYIAIRRGPMRTPTTGTSVFSPVAYAGTLTSGNPQTTGFPVDLGLFANRAGTSYNFSATDRLRGGTQEVSTQQNSAESSSAFPRLDSNTQVYFSNGQGNNTSNGSGTRILEAFRRAPGFFDVVCYTGTGVARTVAHNLGVAPELMIVKLRSGPITGRWAVSSAYVGYMFLELSASADGAPWNFFNTAAPTSTLLNLSSTDFVNYAGGTYVAYLFASCPGVSKVGTYTGTGATQVINCGFAAGARFVLIKRTDSTGDWYVWDSARGIVAGNDPYLTLNSTAAEVTGTDWVNTAASGFELSNAGGNLVNINTASYIFLAIA